MARPSKRKFRRNPPFLLAWRQFKAEQWRRRVTQAEIAEIFQVNRTTVGRMENGELQYNQEHIEKLAEFYKIQVWELTTIDPYNPNFALSIFEKLQRQPREVQERAIRVLEAVLQTG